MHAIGIDVSKGKSTLAIIHDGEVVVKPFTINHTEEDFEKLLIKIKDVDKVDIKFVMEATGVYHLPLLTKLLELNFFVTVENAFLLKKYFDVSLRKVKTDSADAVKIARYCSDKWHELKPYSMQDSTYQDLQFLSRQYTQQISLKVKAKVQLSNLLEVIFPSFNNCFDNEKQYLLMLDILERYPHPSLVLKKSEKSFLQDIEKIAKKRGHRIGFKIATNLYMLAKSTISARPYNESTQLVVTTCVNNLRGLEKATGDIISHMDKLARTLPEYDTVIDMNGVGPKICSRLIAEVGDVRKYKFANSLIAAAGIDTPPYQSGNFTAKSVCISKRGNKYLRKCGYEIMKCLKTSKPKEDSAVYDYIMKKESEGKPLKVCKIAGLNKFLRIYYARVMEVHLQT